MKNKKIISVLLFFLVGIKCFSQVGINTADPEAMLDINGDLRVRITEKCLGESCTDFVLIRNNDGYVQSISKDQLFSSNPKSYVTGTGMNSVILVSVSGATGWGKILFDKEVIDENNDFDITNNTFTAPKDGIYQLYVQYKISSMVSAGELGIGIFVQKGTNTPELVAEETYVNTSVLGIPVSPATRSTQNMVALKAGDQVYFGAKTSMSSIDLLSGTSSLFTIHQVK
ncbi:C1q-like domain-containing protein [Chryseobacterium sp. DT-3]|uniref:C1q-like domain-containing protein n=1 Tax=Chryseobacterium sp. DT-3 TaxID=3396164 RepID=UPI003F1BB03D